MNQLGVSQTLSDRAFNYIAPSELLMWTLRKKKGRDKSMYEDSITLY